MRSLAPEKYHEILTPNYSVCCKRRIFDSTWYPSLHDPKIDLTSLALTSIEENSVTLGPERYYPDNTNTTSKVSMDQKIVSADVIVLANGFEAHHWLHPLDITGRNGQDLIKQMESRGGPQAYQGTAMDGFPNFFMIIGPNTVTGHSSVILATENMTDYIVKFVGPVLRGDFQTVDVKKSAEIAYTQDIQAKLKETVFMKGGCTSWYFTKDGWNSVVLPYSQIWFWYRCQFARWQDWNIKYTTKGSIKLLAGRVVRLGSVLALTFIVLRLLQLKQSGGSIKHQLTAYKSTMASAIVTTLDKAKQAVIRMDSL